MKNLKLPTKQGFVLFSTLMFLLIFSSIFSSVIIVTSFQLKQKQLLIRAREQVALEKDAFKNLKNTDQPQASIEAPYNEGYSLNISYNLEKQLVKSYTYHAFK